MLRALLVLTTFVVQYSLFIISFVIHFLRILSLHIFYDCITIIGHSKGELGTINTLYSPLPSKIVILRPYCHMRLQIKNMYVCMYVCYNISHNIPL